MASYVNPGDLSYAISATITPVGGSAVSLSGARIKNYSESDALPGEGMPFGQTYSGQFSITIDNTAGDGFTPFTIAGLDAAIVQVSIGLGGDMPSLRSTWKVTGTTISEQEAFITINGEDAFTGIQDVGYEDSSANYPQTLYSLAASVAAVAGVTLAQSSWYGSTTQILSMPTWPDNVTCRDILSYVAQAAAGFARIRYDGKLEFYAITDAPTHTVDPTYYTSLSYIGGTPFTFNCLSVREEREEGQEDERYTRYAVNDVLEDLATNTIMVDRSPIMSTQVCNNIKSKLTGAAFDGISLAWFGGLAVRAGDRVTVTDLTGTEHPMILTGNSLSFDAGGMSMTSECVVPVVSTTSTETYSPGSSVFNADGSLNVNAVRNLDTKVVTIEADYYDALDLSSVEGSNLLTKLMNAILLKGQAIDAQSTQIDQLTSIVNTILAKNATRIEGGITDTIAGIGQFNRVYADYAGVNYANVRDLEADTAIFRKGSADELYIDRLVASGATMVAATVQRLALRGTDGNYYALSVGAGGAISAVEIRPSAEEINAGITEDGRVITDTTADIPAMDATTISESDAALSGMIEELVGTGAVTPTDALVASTALPSLRTSAIQAFGASLDLSANETISLLVGLRDSIQSWYTFGPNELIIGKTGDATWKFKNHIDNTGFSITENDEKILTIRKRQVQAETIRIGRVADQTDKLVITEAFDGGIAIGAL